MFNWWPGLWCAAWSEAEHLPQKHIQAANTPQITSKAASGSAYGQQFTQLSPAIKGLSGIGLKLLAPMLDTTSFVRISALSKTHRAAFDLEYPLLRQTLQQTLKIPPPPLPTPSLASRRLGQREGHLKHLDGFTQHVARTIFTLCDADTVRRFVELYPRGAPLLASMAMRQLISPQRTMHPVVTNASAIKMLQELHTAGVAPGAAALDAAHTGLLRGDAEVREHALDALVELATNPQEPLPWAKTLELLPNIDISARRPREGGMLVKLLETLAIANIMPVRNAETRLQWLLQHTSVSVRIAALNSLTVLAVRGKTRSLLAYNTAVKWLSPYDDAQTIAALGALIALARAKPALTISVVETLLPHINQPAIRGAHAFAQLCELACLTQTELAHATAKAHTQATRANPPPKGDDIEDIEDLMPDSCAADRRKLNLLVDLMLCIPPHDLTVYILAKPEAVGDLLRAFPSTTPRIEAAMVSAIHCRRYDFATFRAIETLASLLSASVNFDALLRRETSKPSISGLQALVDLTQTAGNAKAVQELMAQIFARAGDNLQAHEHDIIAALHALPPFVKARPELMPWAIEHLERLLTAPRTMVRRVVMLTISCIAQPTLDTPKIRKALLQTIPDTQSDALLTLARLASPHTHQDPLINQCLSLLKQPADREHEREQDAYFTENLLDALTTLVTRECCNPNRLIEPVVQAFDACINPAAETLAALANAPEVDVERLATALMPLIQRAITTCRSPVFWSIDSVFDNDGYALATERLTAVVRVVESLQTPRDPARGLQRIATKLCTEANVPLDLRKAGWQLARRLGLLPDPLAEREALECPRARKARNAFIAESLKNAHGVF